MNKMRRSTLGRAAGEIGFYYDLIGRPDILRQEDYAILSPKARAGDTDARNKIVESNLRFVIVIAARYQELGFDIEDIIGYGNLGLIIAAERYDESRGYKFTSYAVWWIRQQIIKALCDCGHTIRKPVGQTMLGWKISKAIEFAELLTGQPPTEQDLADAVGESVEAVMTSRDSNTNTVSINTSVCARDGESHCTLQDVLRDHVYVDQLDEAIAADRADKVVVMTKCLTPRQAHVIKRYFGLDGDEPETLEEVGVRIGVTRERVRQIKDQAMRVMRSKNRLLADELAA